MKSSEIYQLMGLHLDLATEAHDLLRGDTREEIPGVKEEIREFPEGRLKIITILNEQGAAIMGREPGSYLTLETKGLRETDKTVHHNITLFLAQQLKQILSLRENSSVLIIGLGNWQATPDSLGPKTAAFFRATRHLFNYAPPEMRQGLRPVSVLAPGVLGLTGIETAEIIKGIVDRLRPDLLIAIDSLAAGSVERINATIQIATTGINPGSGVGNQRVGINQQTMGIPVIAIGVPTVVHAGIIAHQAMEKLLEHLRSTPPLHNLYQGLQPIAIEQMISKVLEPFGGQLMVTPKEIDEQITNTAKIIARSLTLALHPGVDPEHVDEYLN